MSMCPPFLRVPNIPKTITWYESIGFTCLGTHQEPVCELDWAMLERDGAAFMLYLKEGNEVSANKNAGLYFKMESKDFVLTIPVGVILDPLTGNGGRAVESFPISLSQPIVRFKKRWK